MLRIRLQLFPSVQEMEVKELQLGAFGFQKWSRRIERVCPVTFNFSSSCPTLYPFMFFIIAPFQSPLISYVEICLFFSFSASLIRLCQRDLCFPQSHTDKWDCKTLNDLTSWWSRPETLSRLSGGPSGGGDKRDVAPASNTLESEWCQLTVACLENAVHSFLTVCHSHGMMSLSVRIYFCLRLHFFCLVWDLNLGASSFEIQIGGFQEEGVRGDLCAE